jgi:alkylation response protein AidB-like acyl-CoA dehydrogenase
VTRSATARAGGDGEPGGGGGPPPDPHASFLAELHAGRFRWDLMRPFPRQAPPDRAAGAAARSGLVALLRRLVDPDRVDTTRTLPPGLEAALAAGGYLAMSVPEVDGGLGMSPLNVFRLLETAAGECSAAGMLLAWQNVLGVAAYPELLRPDLRRWVTSAVVAGAVAGFGDSEPGGAANARRATVAVPTAGGYLLTGEKLYVGNGGNADLVTVSATVRDGASDQIGLFLVDTTSTGFSVVGRHDLVGLAGAPIAALRLDRVFVPAGRTLTGAGGESWRSVPPVVRRTAFARMAITVTQTLAQARACLGHVRDFLGRRPDMNGRPLSGYDAVQRRVAACLADVFAVDSVVEWCLLGDPAADRLPELTAAKNIGTVTSWRVVDRAVSLLGGEGVETAGSKARRGAPPLPVERLFRDARCLRVAGGVDFNIDLRAAWAGIFAPLYREGGVAGGPPSAPSAPRVRSPGPVAPDAPVPSGAARRHLPFVADQVAALHRRCAALARAHDQGRMAERQEVLIAVNRIADELFTMAATLSRAESLVGDAAAPTGDPALPTGDPDALAGVYCAGARLRIDHHWRVLGALEEGTGGDHAALTRSFLAHPEGSRCQRPPGPGPGS